MLLSARIVTGLFGGVIGSVVLAIATDLFPLEMRGRVMGFMQTAFAASQVLGLPDRPLLRQPLELARAVSLIVGVGTVVGVVIAARLQPVDKHLGLKQEHSAFAHLRTP